MVLYRNSDALEHRHFYNFPEYLQKGDCLVLNNSKVIPTKLIGKRATGGKVTLLLIEELKKDPPHNETWKVLLKTRGIPHEGEALDLEDGALQCHLLSKISNQQWMVQFDTKGTLMEILGRIGRMPLPPYIKRPSGVDPHSLEDKNRYQSVFATQPGSIAAPTASLHFTKELLQEISKKGVEIAYISLHIGLGTFTPIKTPVISRHTMDAEYYEFSPEAAQKLKETQRRGGRVIAVGTSSVRVLETVATQGDLAPSQGGAHLFIHPPYNFKIVDAFLTNFHLPRSTPLMLVSAFAGREKILNAYSIAIKEGYRFYSYGDAMLIL